MSSNNAHKLRCSSFRPHALFLLTLVLCLSTLSAWSQNGDSATAKTDSERSSRYLSVHGSHEFIKGANLPWLDNHYSYYLGVDPHNASWGVAYDHNSMNNHFANMHGMGINVVRLWLFQNDQGCTLDSNGRVTGVSDEFWRNLDDTVKIANNNRIALYLMVTTGRTDFLQNESLLNAFIKNAVVPLAERYKGNDTIFAFDTMNEIDGLVAGDSGNYSSNGATWSQARNYMKTVAGAIHDIDHSRLVTTSSGWHSWMNLSTYFKGLGLDFYDFHQYDDKGYIPSAASLGMDKPVYVGESGQSTAEFNDTIQKDAEQSFLENASNGGYAGLGVWAYMCASCNDYHQLVESNGSWRPVADTILNFKP